MKGKSALLVVLVLIVSIAIGYGAYFGFYLKGQEIIPGINKIRMGLDIAGGVRIVYIPEGQVTDEGLNIAQTILRKRLDIKGLNEATVAIDDKNPMKKMIIVEIPGFNDPKEASEFLGKTAKLQFIEPDGTVVMEGSDIVNAKEVFGDTDAGGINKKAYYIQLTISPDAVSKFAEATERLIGQSISIVIDGELVSSPTVQSKIETVNPIIQGQYTQQEAREQAELISSGALPFTLAIDNQEYIGPTIGQQALQVTLYAGIISFIGIILFLVILYKIPGFISSVALVIYTIVFVLICEWGQITITLPGIAGIILSIAMAVDSSVIIYERLREEIQSGKTLKTSIDLSFSRAFSAIRDSNITTIISAIILWYFGTGPIKGFAISLIIGVVLSLLMSTYLLKFLLKNFANIVGMKNHKLYGA